MKVLKYPIRLNKFDFTLLLPTEAEVLKVAVQHGQTNLWALVDPDAEVQQRRFRLTATGYVLPDAEQLRFIDTFFLHGEDVVYHLFEYKEGNHATPG